MFFHLWQYKNFISLELEIVTYSIRYSCQLMYRFDNQYNKNISLPSTTKTSFNWFLFLIWSKNNYLAKVIYFSLQQYFLIKSIFFLLSFLSDKRKKCLINIDELYLQPKFTFCTFYSVLCIKRRIEKFITYSNFSSTKSSKFFYLPLHVI